jgi:HK97 family phage prohead protease
LGSQVSGYATRFGDIIRVGNDFRERIAPGAFRRTLVDNPDVVMVLDHDPGRVLGRVSAGTLTLREDSIGLWFCCEIDPSTPEGQTAIGTVGRRDVKGCSFGFSARKESWQDDGDSLPLRTIEDVDLYEVTLTAFPAYESTSASLSQSSSRAADKSTVSTSAPTASLSYYRCKAAMEHRLRGI